MSGVLDIDSDNPRLQCSRCGKWSRLYKQEEQHHFPGYIYAADGNYVEIYHDVCVPCMNVLDSMRKDLTLAYEAGKEEL